MKLSLALLVPLLASTTLATGRPKVDMIHPEWMDKTVDPAKDFFGYCNGRWLQTAVIPPDKSSVSPDTVIIDRTALILREVSLAAAKKHAPKGTLYQRVGDFYIVGMDEAKANRLGDYPIQPELRRIAEVHDRTQLTRELAHLARIGVDVGVVPDIEFDIKNSSKYMFFLNQPELSLGDRDVYLQNDERAKRMKAMLIENSAATFALIGDSKARAGKEARQVLDLETQIAKHSRSVEALRDPEKNFNRLTPAAVEKDAPGVDWNLYLARYGLPKLSELSVGQPEYLKSFATLTKNVPLESWKAYMRWQLAHSFSAYLSKPFVEVRQEYAKAMTGQQVLEPRWKRVLRAMDESIGEALGQLYVKVAFPPRAKAKALEIVHNIRLALKERLQEATWLNDSTKAEAIKKLDMMRNKIGYPNKWRDYSKLSIRRDSYAANVMRSNEFEIQRQINRLDKPADRSEWSMTPQTDNAYYDWTFNEVVFPAGILQPTYFDVDADDAANYGGFGATIGHEITHGFDDNGRLFDGNGNLRNWWTKEDEQGFQKAADALAKQFDQYTVSGGIHLNGRQTLGENIADLGGLVIAYQAFQIAEKAHPEGVIDGMSPDQRFFISYGQSWRTKERPQLEQLYAKTDVHSPPKFRVDGIVINVPGFYEAFNEPAPSKVVRIW